MPKEYSSESGAAIVDEPSQAAAEKFQRLSLDLIASSLTNPRKTFNEVKLQELADSIKASGVHQPILVRPLPATRLEDTFRSRRADTPLPTHELVSGERRYRASQLAGAGDIPALIRTLTDDQVLEIQIVENLQRDDLTELEEAEGYERLMQHSELNADAVGAKIGKSRSYVYARLKLLDLSSACKEAMREGQIDASRGLLLARIPDDKLQLKALKYATATEYSGQVPSLRSLQTWLQSNVMLRLDRAPFQITDAKLRPDAGSCKECPKRTGANPDLFSDVDGADICTDPGCYEQKSSAHRAAVVSKAEAKGMTVIDGAEAKKICRQYSSSIEGYSLLNEQRNDATTPGKLGKLLGKDAPAPVLIENPWTKELVEAVPTVEAEAVLLAKGLISAGKATDSKRATLEAEIDYLKRQGKFNIERTARKGMLSALAGSIRSMDDAATAKLLTAELLRPWLGDVIENLDIDDTLTVLMMDGSEDDEGIDDRWMARLQAASDADLIRSAAIYMMLDDVYVGRSYGEPEPDAKPIRFNSVAKVLNVDLDAIKAQAARDHKAETAEAISKIKTQLKALDKPAPAEAKPADSQKISAGSAARPKAGAGGSTSTRPAAPARAAKLSAREATTGIAEAMQGLDAEPGVVLAPDAAWPLPGTIMSKPAEAQLNLQVGFAIGQVVKVTTNRDKLGLQSMRFIGKNGTITSKEPGGGFWNVTFKGRSGGIALFAEDQIEAVPA